MNGASDRWNARDERRRLRDERRATRRQVDSLAYAVRGPVTLITLGVLFALSNFKGIGFDKTWPVLLIVFGLFTLVGRGTASEPQPPAAPAPPPPPAGDWPRPEAQPGGYRQSGYSNQAPRSQPEAETPSGAVKGGFGSSAPQSPKGPADQIQTPPEGGAQ